LDLFYARRKVLHFDWSLISKQKLLFCHVGRKNNKIFVHHFVCQPISLLFELLSIVFAVLQVFQKILLNFKRNEPAHYFYKDYKVFPNINRRQQEEIKQKDFLSDITVVTQMSIERLSRLYYLKKRWKQYISVVLYVRVFSNDYDDFSVWKYLKNERINLQDFKNVLFHIGLNILLNLRNSAWKRF
jgi:hypothetical protein